MGTKTPEPNWHSVRQDGDIEVRDYDPMIVAEVTASGERYAAIKEGFRVLAGYIFGGNTPQTKIAMTAPVMQEALKNPEEWAIRFVMPMGYTMAYLPKPQDMRIVFLKIPATRVAVIRFSGFNMDDNLSRHLDILTGWLKTQNIHPMGPPIYAFYNPPWTLPFLRRNEIMMRISE